MNRLKILPKKLPVFLAIGFVFFPASISSSFITKLMCDQDSMFLCSDESKCVSKFWRCDGDYDCDDRSDEANCTAGSFEQKTNCNPDEFMCQNPAICIPAGWVCDGRDDCPDSSDEQLLNCVNGQRDPQLVDLESLNCHEIENGFFCRADNHCIPLRWRCDGKEECSDGGDEVGCHEDACLPEKGRFPCQDFTKCLNASQVCDGRFDCSDGDDEDDQLCGLNTDPCKVNNVCEGLCMPTKAGPECYCEPGFELVNGTHCKDIDECAEEGRCSQVCINQPGYYECHCLAGYLLTPEGSCVAKDERPTLFFSSQNEIRGIHFSEPKRFFSVAREPLVKKAIGVSYDRLLDTVFWTSIDSGSQGIYYVSLHNNRSGNILTSGLAQPEDLCVDFIGRNVYFTDVEHRFVGVVSMGGKGWRKLIWNVEKPRAISVYSEIGYFFFSDWGFSNPGIYKAAMDGSSSTRIVETRTVWPNGVAVDKALDRVYWSDAHHSILESADLDGGNRRTVLQGTVEHPFSVAIFEDKLYWSEWQLKEVQSCNKFTGENLTAEVKERSLHPMGVEIYHPLLQDTEHMIGYRRNPCLDRNCSHICLIKPSSFHGEKTIAGVCSCPNGFVLDSNRKTCNSESNVKVSWRSLDNFDPSPRTSTPTTSTTSTTATTRSTSTAKPSTSASPPLSKFSPTTSSQSPNRETVDEDSDEVTSKATHVADKNEEETGLLIGIGIAAAIVVILLVILIVFLIDRRRRRNKGTEGISLRFRNSHHRLDRGGEELKNSDSAGHKRQISVSSHDLNPKQSEWSRSNKDTEKLLP